MTTEKIRQLAEQSANEIADLFSTGFFNDRMVSAIAEINKKFGEAIVRECASMAEDEADKYEEQSSGMAGYAIKQHFGIE